MSITSTDVNAAFAAERADQLRVGEAARLDVATRLADGRLQSLGGDRYRIADAGSWDDGEVVTLNAGQLIPQHGLDETRGSAALYTTTPAWHRLGTVVPGGTTDVDEVLHLGGIDYDVHRRPVLFRNELHGPARVMRGHFVTVRDDTQAPLGVVGDKYQVLQNREAFEFLQDLVGRYDVVWESAGALRERPAGVHLDAPARGHPDRRRRHQRRDRAVHRRDQLPRRVEPVPGGRHPVAAGVRQHRTVRPPRRAHPLGRAAHPQRAATASSRPAAPWASPDPTTSVSPPRRRPWPAPTMAIRRLPPGPAADLWPAPPKGASNPTRPATPRRRRHARRAVAQQHRRARCHRRTRPSGRSPSTSTGRSPCRPVPPCAAINLAARATAVLEGTADDLKAPAHRRLLVLTHR